MKENRECSECGTMATKLEQYGTSETYRCVNDRCFVSVFQVTTRVIKPGENENE